MYSPFRHLGATVWKRAPIQLTFFVTRRCNLRCPFCFYLNGAAGPAGSGAPELSPDEVEKVSRSLGRLLWLAFSGGEVFLRDDLVGITGLFYRNNRPAIILYPTNGQLPELIGETTERILRQCPKSVVVVKLSLDGVGAAHDALRARPGSFERALRTYRLLEGHLDRYPQLEVGINTVLCSANQDATEEIIDFVRGLGRARSHTISLIRGRLRDEGYACVDPRRYADAIRRLEEPLGRDGAAMYRFRGGRLKAAQDVVQRRLIHRTLVAGRGLTPCYAGRLNLVLTETGEVYPCERFEGGWGNVRDHGYDLGGMARSETARAASAAIRRSRCFCTHECYAMTNILFNLRWYPRLLAEYLRLCARR